MSSSIDFVQNNLPPMVLMAPMEGVVDPILRELVSAQGGVDLCATEFVRITHQLLPEKVYYHYCPELLHQSRTLSGTPVMVQLLGSDVTLMAENAQRAIELGAFGIDLNFGCPAKTVNSHDGGATLLKNPERVEAVVNAVRKAVPSQFAVSAKVRLGFENKERVHEIANAAESGGASWLTVHARTKAEGYRPPAHWEYISQMREAVKIPVIANGDIWSKDDYDRCRNVSGCKHVMMGRGLIANPGLATEAKTGQPKKPWHQWQTLILSYVRLSEQRLSPRTAVCRSKQQLRIMAQSYGEAKLLFQKIKQLESLPPIYDVLENHFAPEITGHSQDLAPEIMIPKYL
ncbi:MAG: tRNA-dihydrouridine synthase [Bdellovibrionales bacterium]|nr:tRNA-dihydrouridine synthase [Bdellovibrionales bacterium]